MITYTKTIKNGLQYLRHYYVDATDPEGAILKLALRTAFACALSIIIFQYLGNSLLSTWAGFATFAFVQNDALDLAFSRLYFLIAVILIFTVVTFLGMVISYHSVTWFILSVPIITFSFAYLACLGARYFNAGGWAMFLYIMAGSNAASIPQALQISVVFLICGVISLLVCFWVFPARKFSKVWLGYRRVLAKLWFILHILQESKSVPILKLNKQLDHLLLSQEKSLDAYLNTDNLGELIYQLCLMTKSTVIFWGSLSSFYEDEPAHLQTFPRTILMEEMIQAIIMQIKNGKCPNFLAAKKQFALYRENITSIRQFELNKPEPDFRAVLEYTRYFYHYLKMLELLEEISQSISKLQGDL